MAVLDKRISDALSYADEVVDVKKDETIEGIVSVKKAINTLGPVQTVVVSQVKAKSVSYRMWCDMNESERKTETTTAHVPNILDASW